MLPFWLTVDMGAMAMKGLLCIPKRSRAGGSPSGCLVSYPGHSLGGVDHSAEMQLVHSTAPADGAEISEEIYNHWDPNERPPAKIAKKKKKNSQGVKKDGNNGGVIAALQKRTWIKIWIKVC